MTLPEPRPDNERQDYLNEQMREAMQDDGILDVYLDYDGIMRDNGDHLNQANIATIQEALEYFDEISGIKIRYVDAEDKSELSFHRLDATPGQGFELWDVDPRTEGLIHSKGNQDTNIYFEDSGEVTGLTQHIIYHEIAHAFGAYELLDPGAASSEQTIMGYDFNGFFGYTGADQAYFESLY